jgi:hypothetical protein
MVQAVVRRRCVALIAVALVAALMVPAPAAADTRCRYSAGEKTVRLWLMEDHIVQLYALDGKIMYADLAWYHLKGQCGSATVHNTDRVVAIAEEPGSSGLQLRLALGRFGPGATAEDRGISEIEIRLRGVSVLSLLAEGQQRHMTLGENGLNFNADRDADIRGLGSVERVEVYLGDGDDFVSGAGGRGTGDPWDPPRRGYLSVSGSDGNDTLLGSQGRDLLYGFLGEDRLEGYRARDELYGDHHDDVIRGGMGTDILDGGSWYDDLYGGAGDDRLMADDETADQLFGGTGQDYAAIDSQDTTTGVETVQP